jgi:hypothetical protein
MQLGHVSAAGSCHAYQDGAQSNRASLRELLHAIVVRNATVTVPERMENLGCVIVIKSEGVI